MAEKSERSAKEHPKESCSFEEPLGSTEGEDNHPLKDLSTGIDYTFYPTRKGLKNEETKIRQRREERVQQEEGRCEILPDGLLVSGYPR